MKTLKLISALAFLLAIFNLSACKKSASNQIKSSTIELKAVSNHSNLKSVEDYSITSANVNIVNLQIEENSGNDGENVEGGNENEGNETGGSENETDNGDISLSGPFPLNISGGSASIGQVDVYPGTFKKVDFNFQTSTALGGKSIVISGEYTAAGGTVVPFTISSAFSQMVQMPLAGSGVSVSANSSVVIDIVFDVNAWMSGIDFGSATISNGAIIIDNENNTALLAVFEANLTTYVEQED